MFFCHLVDFGSFDTSCFVIICYFFKFNLCFLVSFGLVPILSYLLCFACFPFHLVLDLHVCILFFPHVPTSLHVLHRSLQTNICLEDRQARHRLLETYEATRETRPFRRFRLACRDSEAGTKSERSPAAPAGKRSVAPHIAA